MPQVELEAWNEKRGEEDWDGKKEVKLLELKVHQRVEVEGQPGIG